MEAEDDGSVGKKMIDEEQKRLLHKLRLAQEEAAEAFIAGKPLPPPRGKGTKQSDAEQELSDIAVAIGSTRFMDPPDGGNVSLAEQVTRMRKALEKAEAALAQSDAWRRGT